MKKIIAFGLVCFSAVVFADSMKPLNQIANKANLMTQEPAAISYVFLRCSAAYAVMSGIGSERMNVPKKRADELMKYSTDFLEGSIELDKLNESIRQSNKKLAVTEITQNSLGMQKRLVEYYFSDLKSAKDTTGNYFSGNFLSDVEFCSSLSK